MRPGFPLRIAALVFALGVPQAAHADLRSEHAIDVHVGETLSFDVGYAMGLRCDDVSIIRPDLRGDTPTSNRFSVTGLRPGFTLCRVGTYRGRPTFLFQIRVLGASPRAL